MRTKMYYTICWITFFAAGCCSQCSNPKAWEGIPEDQYDRNATSLKPGGRPLGFDYTILPYIPDGGTNPCYMVTGTLDKRVEIMAEPHGGLNSKICVRDQKREISCNDGKLYTCGQANAESLTVEFFCETGCEQSDISIWVRFMVTPDDYADPEDFCDDRNSDEYPSQLIPIPPDQTFRPIRTTPKGAGTMATAKLTLLVVCFICKCLLLNVN